MRRKESEGGKFDLVIRWERWEVWIRNSCEGWEVRAGKAGREKMCVRIRWKGCEVRAGKRWERWEERKCLYGTGGEDGKCGLGTGGEDGKCG